MIYMKIELQLKNLHGKLYLTPTLVSSIIFRFWHNCQSDAFFQSFVQLIIDSQEALHDASQIFQLAIHRTGFGNVCTAGASFGAPLQIHVPTPGKSAKSPTPPPHQKIEQKQQQQLRIISTNLIEIVMIIVVATHSGQLSL